MRIKLAGKRYKVVLSDIQHLGDCDDPLTKDKRIRIKKGLNGLFFLDTILHEALHACFWMAAEEWVSQTANDMSTLLWRLGYRRQEFKSCPLQFEEVRDLGRKSEEPLPLVETESQGQKPKT